jgi:radical SAM superfamily enzyme YgiQ (UPF0313 family)
VKPVLFLINPPASVPTMRDYFCSSTSKAGYAWQPIDLICQSGHLTEMFDLRVIDAAAGPRSAGDVLTAVRAAGPAAVYSLIGTAALAGDLAFLERVAGESGARVFVSGDIARFHPRLLLARHAFIEGVVLDFTRPALREHLVAGTHDPSALALRGDPEGAHPAARGEFVYPVPRHDLFTGIPYRMTFLGRPFASVLTNYGCPFRCAYCNSGAIGFAVRDADNLLAELDALRDQGIRNVFVKDFTFNAGADRAKMVLREWLRRGYAFRWVGYLRADRIDDELAALLRRTGCAMAQIGIETVNPSVLESLRTERDLARAEDGLAALRRAGVPFGGHFIAGLPGDDEAGFARTVEWATRRGFSYASFNAHTPRPGSRLADARPDLDGMAMDPSRPGYGDAADAAVAGWVRRAYRRFYLRPGYLIPALRGTRAAGGARVALAMGWDLLRSLTGRRTCTGSGNT